MSPAHQADAQAAAFLARRDRGAWADTDQRAFERWIAECDAHRVSYLRLSSGWERLDRLAALRVPSNLTDEREWQPSRWPVRSLAGLAAAIILLVLATTVLRTNGAAPDLYTTGIGGRQSVPLADGTHVDLNTDSRLAVRLGKDVRRVSLERGEAYFEVAHDSAHPFVVEAGSRRIVVLGTKFSVRRDGALVLVRVLEGRVRIDSTGRRGSSVNTILARPGDQVLAVDDRSTTLVKRGRLREVEDALSWRDGLLTFDNGTTLAKAAAEFNRYNRKRLVVSGGAAAVEIEGTFAASDAEAFARILQDAYGFRVENRIDEIIIS